MRYLYVLLKLYMPQSERKGQKGPIVHVRCTVFLFVNVSVRYLIATYRNSLTRFFDFFVMPCAINIAFHCQL